MLSKAVLHLDEYLLARVQTLDGTGTQIAVLHTFEQGGVHMRLVAADMVDRIHCAYCSDHGWEFDAAGSCGDRCNMEHYQRVAGQVSRAQGEAEMSVPADMWHCMHEHRARRLAQPAASSSSSGRAGWEAVHALGLDHM